MAENETLWNWDNHQKYHAYLKNYIGTKITEHSSDAVSHITADERTAWNGKTTIDECAETFINPNLIINSNFKINQRGKTEYTEKGCTVDGWYNKDFLVTTTVLDKGIRITYPGTATAIHWQYQTIEYLEAGTYMSSVKLRKSRADLSVRFYEAYTEATTDWQVVRSLITVSADGSYTFIFATTDRDLTSGDWIEVERVKLEPGLIATPYVDPDEALELVRCQRTLQFHTAGDIDPIDLRPTMRITPTVTQMEDGRWMYNAEL